MTEHSGGEQPAFESTLEATAVDLITTVVQETFTALDPIELVRTHAAHLSAEDQVAVADLIDNAVVEIEVGFSGHTDEHQHDHN